MKARPNNEKSTGGAGMVVVVFHSAIYLGMLNSGAAHCAFRCYRRQLQNESGSKLQQWMPRREEEFEVICYAT